MILKSALRQAVIRGSDALGVSRLFEAVPRTASMLVLTYHRIGNPADTAYDPGVFSTTQDGFARQLEVLKRTHTLIDVDEATSILCSRKPFRGSVALITFDDGYLDNLTHAVPVLTAANAPAVFFLVTDFLDGVSLPWWDSIAYIVKQSTKSAITLDVPHRVALPLHDDVPKAIATVLKLFRLCSGPDRATFITQLEERCGCAAPTAARDLMMSWSEAQTLGAHRVSVGAHTVSHPILANVSTKQQEFEIVESRRRLESRLGRPVTTFAYPVGYRGAFSQLTQDLVRQAGYQVAFSYYGGSVDLHQVNPFDVTRVGVSGHDIRRFRLQAATYPYWNLVRLGGKFRTAA